MREQVDEAPLRPTDDGLRPDGEGWFIVNVAEAAGVHSEEFGDACRFEGSHAFPEFGINVRVIQPGQPNALYHRESNQEAFLVLSGECVAIVEEQERRMSKGDFLYAPLDTAHVLVGAGEEPCAVLMVGTRDPAEELLYPVSKLAARHGASSEEETSEPRVAYAGASTRESRRLGLPW